MLRRVDLNDTKNIEGALEKYAEYNVRLGALINAYSVDKPFFNLYHDDFKTILAELEGNFYIGETDEIDFEEIREFLSFYGNVKSVLGKRETIEKIGFPDNGEIYNLLTLDKQNNNSCDCEIERNPKLQDVYDLLKMSDEKDFTVADFMPWYADMSHRIRHGSAKAYLLKKGTENVSCLLISAFSKNAALISGVTTIKNERNKGYAKKLLSAVLCEDILEKRTAVIECENRLLCFYKNFGFKKTGEIKIIKPKDNL